MKIIKKFIIELTIATVLFLLFSAWRESDLLSSDGSSPAPYFSLPTLAQPDTRFSLAELKGETSVLYFFAPWCTICRVSMPNLETLAEKQGVRVIAVALDYEHPAEVVRFVEDLGLSMPVLLGDRNTAGNYRISAFPTYYVVNPELKITARSMGYSTELGLKLRTSTL